MNEILLKEMDVLSAFCEAAASEAIFRSMVFMEASPDPSKSIIDAVREKIAGLIQKIKDFFQKINERIHHMIVKYQTKHAAGVRDTDAYKFVMKECNEAYRKYLSDMKGYLRVEMAERGYNKKKDRNIGAVMMQSNSENAKRRCMKTVNKVLAKAAGMNASQLDLLSDDMFEGIKGYAVAFQNDLDRYCIAHRKDLSSNDVMTITAMSLEAGNTCYDITKAILNIKNAK